MFYHRPLTPVSRLNSSSCGTNYHTTIQSHSTSCNNCINTTVYMVIFVVISALKSIVTVQMLAINIKTHRYYVSVTKARVKFPLLYLRKSLKIQHVESLCKALTCHIEKHALNNCASLYIYLYAFIYTHTSAEYTTYASACDQLKRLFAAWHSARPYHSIIR